MQVKNLKCYVPGTHFQIASNPSIIEPRLCPIKVKQGYIDASTSFRLFRYIKSILWADSSILNRFLALIIISSGLTLSPVYMKMWWFSYLDWMALTAHQRTRSPPPPALQYGWKIPILVLPLSFFFKAAFLLQNTYLKLHF